MEIYINMDERSGSASRTWGERLARLFRQRSYRVTFDPTGDWAAAFFIARSEGIEAALKRGRPVGYRVANGYHPTWFEIMGREMKPEHHAVNAATARALEIASTVIYQSNWAKAELDQLLYPRSEGCRVIYNGIDLKLFHPGYEQPNGLPVIGTVGRLRYRYRLETLFEMSLRLDFPHRLLVVGSLDEECAEVLRRYQLDPLIGPRLDYHPAAPWEELPALYNRMSILVHPVSGDACPNVVIEALACGVPVVAPAHGGTAELVGEVGEIFTNTPWVYDEAFIEGMAAAVSRLLPKAQTLRKPARQRAEKMFDLEAMVDGYLEALHLPPRVVQKAEQAAESRSTTIRRVGASAIARPRFYAAVALRMARQAQRRILHQQINPRPRIAFTLFDFQVGGIENWLYRLAKELQGQFDFYFLATRVPEPLPKFKEVGEFAYLPGPVQMTRFLQKRRIDLVQVHNERWPVDAALAAGVPHIVERLGGQRSWRRVPKWGLDRIIASSQMAADAISDLAPPESILRIYNGIDLEEVDAAQPRRLFAEEDLIIGRTSRFGRGQNLGLLIDALARLQTGYPHLRLVLVGGDSPLPGAEPVLQGLRRQSREAGLEAKITFTGPVEDGLPYVQGFDIGTCVSNDEGLPNSLIEAMACRKAVISTDVGAIRELVEHEKDGLLIPPGDLNALCAAMQRLAEDPTLRRRLGEEARKTVESRFSLKASAAEYAQVYRQLLGH